MKNLKLLLTSLVVVGSLLFTSHTVSAQNYSSGKMGFSASMAMPTGITPSVALPNNTFSRITISLAAGTSFNYLVSDNFQVDLGLGFLSVDNGGGADAASTVSVGLAGKYYFSGDVVTPYATVGFSYTQIPTIESGAQETSGNMTTILGAIGAQSFIDKGNNVAVFIQMGVGYNMGTVTTEIAGQSNSNDASSLNFGGSAIGFSVYFN